jgi:hypothetical protein
LAILQRVSTTTPFTYTKAENKNQIRFRFY